MKFLVAFYFLVQQIFVSAYIKGSVSISTEVININKDKIHKLTPDNDIIIKIRDLGQDVLNANQATIIFFNEKEPNLMKNYFVKVTNNKIYYKIFRHDFSALAKTSSNLILKLIISNEKTDIKLNENLLIIEPIFEKQNEYLNKREDGGVKPEIRPIFNSEKVKENNLLSILFILIALVLFVGFLKTSKDKRKGTLIKMKQLEKKDFLVHLCFFGLILSFELNTYMYVINQSFLVTFINAVVFGFALFVTGLKVNRYMFLIRQKEEKIN